MSNLHSVATGNWLTSTTWGLADASAAAYLNSETGTSTCPTSSGGTSRSASFTPGAITVYGIAIKLANRTGSTGTITAALYNSTAAGLVAGGTQTINVSDLPAAVTANADGGWILFKFATPVLLIVANAYMVDVITSNATQVDLFRDGTANNWSRMIITTTNQAPVAGDDVVIGKEWTGAGAGNALTVTMDETADTDYGSATNSNVTPAVAVCNGGTLKFKDTSAANPKLRSSGCVICYNGGTFTIGTVATPIPRDSIAKLRIDPAADGDMGLIGRPGSTVTIQGLSRTSAKSIVSCKLSADAPTALILVAVARVNGTGAVAVDPTGTSIVTASASAFTDNSTNGNHNASQTLPASVTNTTQTVSVEIAAGSGTNKRYVRLQLGDATGTLTNGFYADIDLQAGTIGSCTAVGNGTATSSSISAYGSGFICTIIGKASSGAQTPKATIAACNASGVISYAGDTTQNFIHYGLKVFTASALPALTLTVDTDTGWKSGDVIAIASTSRTSADSEIVALGSDAGASTLTLATNLVFNHSGTSPTQAEIILLSRNVIIESVTNTLMVYVNFKSTAVVDVKWSEFRYLGQNATDKRGVEINTTTGSCSIMYSSFHDFEAGGIDVVGGSTNNITVQYCGSWQTSNTFIATSMFQNAATSGTANLYDSLIFIGGGSSASPIILGDIGGTFSNITMAGFGANANAMTITEGGTPNVLGPLTFHSNNNSGPVFASGSNNCLTGSITGPVRCWRNTGSYGINLVNMVDLTIDQLDCFGNLTTNVTLGTGLINVKLTSPVLAGDTTFATANGFLFTNGSGISLGAYGELIIENGSFGVASGIRVAHTAGDFANAAGSVNYGWAVTMRNTVLASTNEIATGTAGKTNWTKNAFIRSQKHDQTVANHKTERKYGTIATDAVVYDSASPSVRMTPNNASNKLDSAMFGNGFNVAVANGVAAVGTARVRKSAVGDAGGADYNGNQIRLMQRANPALGQNSDVVLATGAAAVGTWETLSWTTSSPTDDGVFELFFDCDGTAGWINVDTFKQTGGVDPAGGMKYWGNGLPSDSLVAQAAAGGLLINPGMSGGMR